MKEGDRVLIIPRAKARSPHSSPYYVKSMEVYGGCIRTISWRTSWYRLAGMEYFSWPDRWLIQLKRRSIE